MEINLEGNFLHETVPYIRLGASPCLRFLPSWPCGGWKSARRILETRPRRARRGETRSGATTTTASAPTTMMTSSRRMRPASAAGSASTARRMRRMTWTGQEEFGFKSKHHPLSHAGSLNDNARAIFDKKVDAGSHTC